MSMTPMNNFDYLDRVKFADELAAIEEAKKASGLTYEELAEKIGVNKVWLTSAIKGQRKRQILRLFLKPFLVHT